MDTTETTTEQFAPIPEPVITLDAQAKYFLHTAGRWATFLGILGFIGTGLVLLCAVFVGTVFSLLSRFNPTAMMGTNTDNSVASSALGAASGFVSFFYVLIAVFYFFMSYYIYKFGTGIKKSMMFSDSIGATKAFEYLKSHLKLIGITAIVFISFYILIIIIVVIAAASAMH